MATPVLRTDNLCWTTIGFLVGYHLAVLVGVPVYLSYRTPGLDLILISAALLLLTEIGIGAAYHRFYAHRSYVPNKVAEAGLLFLATLAVQGSALRWAHDHRKHHAHVDTDADPYAITKGFWYAHFLWLFEKLGPLDERIVSDLASNRLVMLQHRLGHTLSIVGNLAVTALVGWWVGDFVGAFLFAFLTRLLVSHHLTWSVNSLAHTWGERTYTREHSAVDNFALALVTVGEGYHNFHHTFPSDYRNGVRWYHFDPNKWLIWLLGRFGLARELKRMDEFRIRARLLREDRRLLAEHLGRALRERREELEQRVERLSGRLHANLDSLARMSREARRLRLEGQTRLAREYRRRVRRARQAMRRDWQAWHRLCGTVLATPAVA